MTRLTDYAFDTFSQFGEDGCIAHIFGQIGERSRVCVEFGAGDGLSCSNTARLWRSQGWSAVLLEAEPSRYDFLEATAIGFDAITEHTFVTPRGPNSIDAILAQHGIEEVDFMSIDIDGDDYAILESLTIRPRVICIEFNPTVPPHISLHQRDVGGTFGASLRAIVALADIKGYRFLGATHCNAFLIDEEEWLFDGYETDLRVLFPPEKYTYAVTDGKGDLVLVGQELPWGAKGPYIEPLIGHRVQPATDNVAHIYRSFEARWGPAVLVLLTAFVAPTLAESRALFATFLAEAPPLVCFDLTYDQPGAEDWLVEQAEASGYRVLSFGRVLGLILPLD